MIVGIHHIGINVRDLDQAITFFTTAGLTVARHDHLSAWLHAPNGFVRIQSSPNAVQIPTPIYAAGISHICIQTPHIATSLDPLLAHGYHANSAPVDLNTGHRYVYIHDSDANVLELEGVPYAPATQIPWLSHVAFATSDIVRLGDFYQRLLNGDSAGGQPIGPHPRYDEVLALSDVRVIPRWIKGTNLTVELWQFLHPVTTPQPPRHPQQLGYHYLCLEVTDITSTIAHALECGAQLIEDDLAEAWLHDPDGNLLWLVESAHLPMPAIHTLAEPHIIARINALWRRD